MQELRIVLIVVGVVAIAGLLFHGLWTNRREESSKFSDKPLGKLDREPPSDKVTPVGDTLAQSSIEDDFDVVKVTKKSDKREPSFSHFDDDISDPLLDSGFGSHSDESAEDEHPEPISAIKADELPTITIGADAYSNHKESLSEPIEEEPILDEVQPVIDEPVASAPVEEELPMEVLVLNVKAGPNQEFVGTDLFESMENNGLHFGAMNIYHRHADISGNGKVLFSVANMLQPGTLLHDDPATFTTEGISFFMTLPSYGDPEQNFKIMLHTAQMIADDLSGHVLDEKRMLMTRDRIDAFKRQIQRFVQKKREQETSNVT